MTTTRWVEPPRLTAEQLAITQHPLLSAILHARGVRTHDEAAQFLSPGRVPFVDPFLLPDVERAVATIRRAIAERDRIGIFGDYDVDGLTSTAMLGRVLRRLGAHPLIVVPNRLTEVYGLSIEAVDRFHQAGVRLLITVDCGSSNARELEYALGLGMACVVIDHHQLGTPLPEPVAFVSPRRPESGYPLPNPAAVGVVWMVVRALLGDDEAAEMYLPYVALGTVADVVDLRGQNRTLVTRGIAKLRRWRSPGLMALCAVSAIDQARIRTREVGHIIGPRLNAAGRMDTPQLALDLLLADTAAEATPLALRLHDLNTLRQAETKRMFTEAAQMIDRAGGPDRLPAIVVADGSWSVGVAGIVAGRIADRYHRPAIVFERGDLVAKGSGRARGAIDLVGALRRLADLLERYGGHKHAAGLTLPTSRLDQFRDRFMETVLEMSGGEIPGRILVPDAEARTDDLCLATVDLFDALEPFGEGNPYPTLLVRDVATRWEKTSADGKHLLFTVVGADGRTTPAVYFGAGGRIDELRAAGRIDIVGELQRDDWDGRLRAKLYVADFRPAAR